MTELELHLASGRLHGEASGPEGGAPVVCLPGLSANLRSLDAVASALAARGHRVVVLDLRGRGRSDATPPGTYGWAAHARDVLEAATRLGFERFDLVGHSMGAFVALQLAATDGRRLRRAVLLDAAGPPERPVIPPILASLERLGRTYPSADAYCEAIEQRGTAVPWAELWRPHALYELEEVDGGVRSRTSPEAVTEDLLYGGGHDARALWPSLRVPTLLVRAALPLGAEGAYVVGEALREAFRAAVPGAEVVEVQANHYGVVAHPDALAAIARFLA